MPYTDHTYVGVLNRILMPKKRSAWSARFPQPVDERVKRFTASVGFDRRLAKYDIAGLARPRAHAGGAAASSRGATSPRSSAGSRRIEREIDAGRFRWSLDAEDVHLNIERRLTALVGDAGKRLHTARSRNDQVATDVRLWLRDEIDALACPARGPAARAARPGRAPRRAGHAGLHPSAGRAAGDLRPSPDGVCRDARARPRTLAGLQKTSQPAAAGRGGARRHQLPDRPQRAWHASSASRACARTRSTRCPTATSRSSSAPPPRS